MHHQSHTNVQEEIKPGMGILYCTHMSTRLQHNPHHEAVNRNNISIFYVSNSLFLKMISPDVSGQINTPLIKNLGCAEAAAAFSL